MNTIATQIDQAADILSATNDLLEARARHRDAQSHGNIHAVIDAYVKVKQAERYLAQMYPPEDKPVPEFSERMTLNTDETFTPRQPRMTADERADDPRRGQGDRRYAK